MSHVITGQELKSQRVFRGMSQAQVGALMHVNQKTIANWESGQVPEAREDELRELIFFEDTPSLLHWVPTEELHAELMRRMNRLEALVAAAPPARPEDQWHSASPPRRTRQKRDTPEPEA